MASWQASVRPVVDRVMEARAVPGIVIAVARGDDQPQHLVAGSDRPSGRPLAEDSLFPVASLTKLATALAVLRLVEHGALALDDPLARHLPDAAAAREAVTLRLLLSHTSGLPYDLAPDAAPYTPALDWPTLARACLATPLAAPPRTRVNYSNVGMGLLAIVVERQTGRRFAAALADLVLTPLDMEGYLGDEPPRAPVWIAGADLARTDTGLDPLNSPFWYSLALPWGGLVTTAAGALTLVRAFAGRPTGFLSPELLADATRDQTGGLAGARTVLQGRRGRWGLGVELRGDQARHWTPAEASPTSFGHVGTSGCLAWVDPTVSVAWAMLGARYFVDWWRDWPAIGAAILAACR